MDKNQECDIIIFGGHGDLALRKLMPALYHLFHDHYLSEDSRVISVSRDHFSQDEHLALIRETLQKNLKNGYFDESTFQKFVKFLTKFQKDF